MWVRSILLGCFLTVTAAAAARADVQLAVSTTQPGAYATPQAAVAAVARLRSQNANLHEPVIITLAGGTYYLPRPLNISDDLGPLTITAAPNQTVVLSGGTEITDWTPATFNGHTCWAARVPAVRVLQWNFRQLWVNGKRAIRARFPAHGYLASVIPDQKNVPWNQGQNWFGYKPGDVPDQLPEDAEAIILNRWVEARLTGLSVDVLKKSVSSRRMTQYSLEDGDPYWLEGSPQWLTEPGDWYLDRKAATVYYLPRPGEKLSEISAIAPRLASLLEMKGSSDVTLHGLTFSHTQWDLPDTSPQKASPLGGFGQAAVGVPAAVTIDHAKNCRFENCTFEHLGNYALQLGCGCQGDRVDRCTFTDLGAGGIKIGEENQAQLVTDQTFGNVVSDCRISDGGHIFPSAVGIWIGQSYDNHIEHNEITDLYYTAISMGWTWGYGPALCKGNKIEANLIHHIGKKSDADGPILSDMGGIYTLGVQPGSVISGNAFHDIAGRIYGGWGIYLDEGSSNILVEKNIVYQTTHGGFHQHFGRDNIVQNNIFAFGRDVQIARSTAEPPLSFTFKRNIVAWDTGVFTKTTPDHLLFDGNLYHCTGVGQLQFGTLSWDQWRAAGMDTHSILDDPKFKDMKTGDFTPAPEVAARIGFQSLDLAHVGPR
jgi:parallel beta-helix repeat protein